ncbi:Putative sterigmatocystin biosynthesis monooxygenase stcW [Psilocybe cubensis]|uniref:Sterigmatocystin biosynthesis monooxygenase stcW n=1 Tax=Psilocybe cubensis TaxID=181762 RepID=A0ACB8HEU3_PSICU|nr:Putative sterigmatocystin biosynthesis monooxygenase stcW [Psilocybe cubensis]KAH9486428.1 Putative sterigmatocystin biosynthesis monooxygenase stcW [Psilocybe cubensis]
MNNNVKAQPAFKLGEFSIDDPRPIKVAIIGAGHSGIVAGIRFRQRVPNMDLTIYESLPAVGGTWYANRYPGLQCDIPSHAYQPTFETNTEWSAFYASGREIQQFMENMVDKYQLRPFIKLQHRLTAAHYAEKSGKWELTIKHPRKASNTKKSHNYASPVDQEWEEFHDTVDILFIAVGPLSRWTWPDIPGLENFSGTVVHSADWNIADDEASLGDKRVGVIGVGSSAIQIVAALQPKVKHLVNYVRGKTWIAAIFNKPSLDRLSQDINCPPDKFTDKDKEAFKDPKVYNEFRREIETDMNHAHPATLLGSPLEKMAREEFTASMRQKLTKKPWIADHLIPDFGVCCRRLTPGPGYLEALCEDNVTFVPSLIKNATPEGIVTVDGKFEKLDIIVCATGFETSFRLDVDIRGRNGISLNDHHNPHPRTYLSVAVDGFPNMFQALGPNASVGAGNLLLIMERQVDYAVAATLKIQRERIKSIEAKSEAVDDFDKYIDVSSCTVFGTKCRSWYKAGKTEGRVVALWPGSPIHAARALAHPRWEDFNYEYLDPSQNRLHWLGDGNTVADRDPNGDSMNTSISNKTLLLS